MILTKISLVLKENTNRIIKYNRRIRKGLFGHQERTLQTHCEEK